MENEIERVEKLSIEIGNIDCDYNIGDTVYFLDGSRISKKTIREVQVLIKAIKTDYLHIHIGTYYVFIGANGPETISSNYVYASKDELILSGEAPFKRSARQSLNKKNKI